MEAGFLSLAETWDRGKITSTGSRSLDIHSRCLDQFHRAAISFNIGCFFARRSASFKRTATTGFCSYRVTCIHRGCKQEGILLPYLPWHQSPCVLLFWFGWPYQHFICNSPVVTRWKHISKIAPDRLIHIPSEKYLSNRTKLSGFSWFICNDALRFPCKDSAWSVFTFSNTYQIYHSYYFHFPRIWISYTEIQKLQLLRSSNDIQKLSVALHSKML